MDSNTLIGPGQSCIFCGKGYGEHTATCPRGKEPKQPTLEERVAALEKTAHHMASVEDLAAIRAALRQFGIDGHAYGSRPCATCAAMTAALGEPFGCDLYRKRKGS